MRMMERGAALLVAASIVGCSGGADAVSGIDARTAAPTVMPGVARLGLGARVTGHANMILPHFGGAVQRYSSTAIRLPNGSVSGQWEVHSEQDDGLRVHGRVLCLSTAGNAAQVVGVIDQSTDPRYVGWHYYWTIVDNGEGPGAPPDLTSDFWPVAERFVQLVCSFPPEPLFAELPVLGGNLIVRP